MTSLTSGQSLLHYHILQKIGQGGMGEVYKAEDSKLRRIVAIKVLRSQETLEQTARKRFLNEARLASALNHPNIVTIHSIEESNGLDFIVMEYVEGESLRTKIERGPIQLPQLLEWGAQIADALAAAHSIGLIHRDIKPANILITPFHQAKVLDFGLAKIMKPQSPDQESELETISRGLTATGVVVGTVAYMSPEQIRGEELDARSDIFSLGCLLYEAATGKLPFNGPSAVSLIHEIAEKDPPPPSRIKQGLPNDLDRIVMRALEKKKETRYSLASEFAASLRLLKTSELESESRKGTAGYKPGRNWKILAVSLTITAAIVLTAAVIRFYWQNRNIEWARKSVPQVEELSKAQKYFEAYDLAIQIQKYLPGIPAITQLMPRISDTLSIITKPAGASVYLKRFQQNESGNFPPRQRIGTTPVQNLQIARGQYILDIEKEGYAKTERTISGALENTGRGLFIPPAIQIEEKLTEATRVPNRMALVPGGDYRLVSWTRPTEIRVSLEPYYIDRYEVSNREYKEFLNAGGYLKKQYWKHPFVNEGKILDWKEAMERFKDRTGLPGPRIWSSGNFPDGKGDHPVTDISWYEAAAYAAFRSKQLPSIFQWEKAARDGAVSPLGNFMPWGLFYPGETLDFRANFKTGGTLSVTSSEFGMSPYGCYNMAGNVGEWCLNETSEGFLAGGGSWGDPPYMFGAYGTFPGFYSSSKLGFRCVMNPPGSTGNQGALFIKVKDEIPVYTPSSEKSFKGWLEYYRYDQTPLDPRVVEVQETEEWRREKISFIGADGERAMAYLYLPKSTSKPWQVIHAIPGSNVEIGVSPLTDFMEGWLKPFIQSGRAAFGVVLKGYAGRKRPETYIEPAPETVEYREKVVNWTTDLRRGIDYLQTRKDLDSSKIAFFGHSAGARVGLIVAAVDTRYRSVLLISSGIRKSWEQWIPGANPISFAAHIHGPKLILNGQYDESFPYKTHCEPLFRLLPEPKRLEMFEGGHIPPPEVYLPAMTKWFDETLGPVRHE